LQGWNTSNFIYDKDIVNISSLASPLRQTIQGIFYAAYRRISEISEVEELGKYDIKRACCERIKQVTYN